MPHRRSIERRETQTDSHSRAEPQGRANDRRPFSESVPCAIDCRPRSRSFVLELEAWLREQRAKLSGQSETAKATAYSLTRWAALTRFLDDGRLCMSNNAAEREVRAVAVGRKNWTFAGSDEGGRRAAAIYT